MLKGIRSGVLQGLIDDDLKKNLENEKKERLGIVQEFIEDRSLDWELDAALISGRFIVGTDLEKREREREGPKEGFDWRLVFSQVIMERLSSKLEVKGDFIIPSTGFLAPSGQIKHSRTWDEIFRASSILSFNFEWDEIVLVVGIFNDFQLAERLFGDLYNTAPHYVRKKGAIIWCIDEMKATPFYTGWAKVIDEVSKGLKHEIKIFVTPTDKINEMIVFLLKGQSNARS